MKSDLFRKESIDRLKSPEQLNKYIKVARPGVWLLLAASILLLAGLIIWAVFGTAETVVRVGVQITGGNAVCYVNESAAVNVEPGMPVTVQNHAGTIAEVGTEAVQVDQENLVPFLMEASNLDPDGTCNIVTIDITGIEDGMYIAEIAVEQIHPISFLIK